MSIDHSQERSVFLPWFRVLKPSHRTFAEQWVGLGIFLLMSLGFEILNAQLIQRSWFTVWHHYLTEGHWAIAEKAYGPIWTLYFLMISFAIWSLWRRYSLRVLKWEISVFVSQFLFQIGWSFSFFVLQETLLALVALLLLWCNHLLVILLFGKKESIAGKLLILPFFWIFYCVGLNMVICISNP